MPNIGLPQRPPREQVVERIEEPPDAPIPRGQPQDIIARPPTPPPEDAPERAPTPEPMEEEPIDARAQEPMETIPTAHNYPLRKRPATITAPELELAKRLRIASIAFAHDWFTDNSPQHHDQPNLEPDSDSHS